MKKMREMGMKQPVVGSNGFNSPEFIKIAGAAADGVSQVHLGSLTKTIKR